MLLKWGTFKDPVSVAKHWSSSGVTHSTSPTIPTTSTLTTKQVVLFIFLSLCFLFLRFFLSCPFSLFANSFSFCPGLPYTSLHPPLPLTFHFPRATSFLPSLPIHCYAGLFYCLYLIDIFLSLQPLVSRWLWRQLSPDFGPLQLRSVHMGAILSDWWCFSP